MINQCNKCIINKTDILEEANTFKLYHNSELKIFTNFDEMREHICKTLDFIETIIFSNNKYNI